MDRLDQMEAIEALKQLKARYFLYLDGKQWEDWARLLTPDAVMDTSAEFPDAPDPSVHVLHGAEAIAASVSRYTRNMVTIHHGFTPIIELTEPDEATGIWAMEDRLIRRDGTQQTGCGHYHDVYRRIDGIWYIHAMRITRLWRGVVPA